MSNVAAKANLKVGRFPALALLQYPNGVLGGAATSHTLKQGLTNQTLAQLSGMGAADTFSFEVRGSFAPPAALVTSGAMLRLSCDIAHGSLFV